MNKICQSCGMYINDDLRGTNADQTLNEDYCIYCYQNGSFLYDDTMEEKIEKCIPFHIDETTDENAARQKLLAYFPKLKRWKLC